MSENTETNKIRLAVIVSAAGIAVFALIVLLAPFLRESLFDRLFPKDPSDAYIPDNDSGWAECNGWATNPNYDKYACRTKALQRARASYPILKGKSFYDIGLPLPPSGDKSSTEGSDQAWHDWGLHNNSKLNPALVGATEIPNMHFLSEGTSCGIGPSVCVPTPTPTPTTTPASTPTPTPTPVPNATPTPTNTPTPTSAITPTPTITPSPVITLVIPTVTPTPIPNLACLGNRVILDTVRNDVQDANENGVAGVTVRLLSSTNTQLASTVTDNQGYYEFCGLEGGDYTVTFEQSATYSFAQKGVGGSNVDSDADPTTGKTDNISLSSGQNRDDIDAILYPVCSSVGDYVFFDENKNGVQDRGEFGIANIAVTLHAHDGQVLATTTTDNNGYYDFGCINAGAYYINFTVPEGYAFSPQNNGDDDNLDCDVNPLTGNTGTINLGQDDVQDTWDACIFVLGTGTSKPLPNTGTVEVTLLVLALAGGLAVTGKFLIFGKQDTN